MPLTKRWLFRVSSHLRHGRGHVARCTVLAEEMREKGYNVFFQLDQESIDAATRLKKKVLHVQKKIFLMMVLGQAVLLMVMSYLMMNLRNMLVKLHQ